MTGLSAGGVDEVRGLLRMERPRLRQSFLWMSVTKNGSGCLRGVSVSPALGSSGSEDYREEAADGTTSQNGFQRSWGALLSRLGGAWDFREAASGCGLQGLVVKGQADLRAGGGGRGSLPENSGGERVVSVSH